MNDASVTDADAPVRAPFFLQGGGICGALLRGMDWSQHPLGDPDDWPPILQTTVSIILGSRQPMYVSWGPDLLTLYNDDYAAICANRHPAAMGRPFFETWADIRQLIGHLVDEVLGGKPLHVENLEVFLNRHQSDGAGYFSFSYTPLRDEENVVVGIFCACAEITKQVVLQRELDHERAKLAEIFELSPSFIAKLHGPEHIFEFANPAYMRMIGDRSIIGQPLKRALPEIVGQGFIEQLDSVLETGETIRTAAKVSLQRSLGQPMEDRFVDFAYLAVKDSAGNITGSLATGLDVTERMQALSALKSSEQFLRSIISASSDCIKVVDFDGAIA